MIRMKLHLLMAEIKISQRELSDITKIRQATLSAYYNDTSIMFTKEHLDILCKFFKCNIESLIEYVDDEIGNTEIKVNDKDDNKEMSKTIYVKENMKTQNINTLKNSKLITNSDEKLINKIMNSKKFNESIKKALKESLKVENEKK